MIVSSNGHMIEIVSLIDNFEIGDIEAIFDLLEEETMKKKEKAEEENHPIQENKTQKKLDIIAIDESETIFSPNNHGKPFVSKSSF